MKILNKITIYLKRRRDAFLILSIFIALSVITINANSGGFFNLIETQVVYNNDEFVTFISDEKQQVESEEGYSISTQEVVIPMQVDGTTDYQEKIEKNNTEILEGYEVKIDEKVIYLKDVALLTKVIDEVLVKYLPTDTFDEYKQSGKIKPFSFNDLKIVDVAIENEITITKGNYPANDFIDDEDELKFQLFHENQEKKVIAIDEETTISDIIEQSNLSEINLFINNDLTSDSLFYENQQIIVNPLDPIFDYSIVFESQHQEEIEFLTNEVQTDDLLVGQEEIETQGSNGRQEVKLRTRFENGEVTSSVQTDVNILVPPVSETILIGSKEKPGVGTGEFGWPQSCKNVSNGYDGFTGIEGIPHLAIDIGCSHLSPIYAADNGVVVYSQWSPYGGGNEVSIDHKNGYKTKYAHMNESIVEVGDVVSKGEVIGYQGSTGNSRATHLHYEIYTGDGYTTGKRLNPLDFY